MARFFALAPGMASVVDLLVSTDGSHFEVAAWLRPTPLITADEILRALLAAEATATTGEEVA